jgi:NTE family protein
MAIKEGETPASGGTNGYPKSPPGIGLALGGGMARGFAHIGVLNVLKRYGITPSIVAGTSIGALVGGCYMAGKLKEFEQWAFSLNRMKILSYLDFRVRSAGLIGGKKLFGLLEQNFGDMKIEDMPFPFVTVASDLLTGHEVWIREGNAIEAMKASFALPGVFPPVMRNDRLLVDGALLNPVPVSVLQALGARMTIAVDLQGDMIGRSAKPGKHYPIIAGFDMFNEDDVPKEEQERLNTGLTRRMFRREEDAPSLFGTMISAIGIMQDRLTRTRLAGDPPDVHIKPKIGHIGLMEFEKASELIAEGEAAAVRALPEIREAIQVLIPNGKK